jgi:hypothetical protein
MVQQERLARHLGLKVFVLLCALMVITIPAMAARGGNSGGGKHGGGGTTGSGGGSLSLKMVIDANSNSLPNYGDQVTFNVSTTVTDKPYVVLGCTQGGGSVYQSSFTVGFFADYPWPWLQTYTLSSQTWTGGAANCTATLQYNTGSKWAVITSLNFDVRA